MKNNDIQAFPDESSFGMTLRDYFAAKAMQGMLARKEPPSPDDAAEIAFTFADAMLEGRLE